MKNFTGFLETIEETEHGWMLNGTPNKIIGGSIVQIKEKILIWLLVFKKY